MKTMKKRVVTMLLTAVLGLGAVQPAWAADWQTGNPLIAHALGEADGKIELNTKEAFIAAWENGFRVVEADFVYTSDNVLVLRHDFEKDGSYYRLEIEPEGKLVMDSKTFKATPAVFEQTPLTAVDLISLMIEYPDVYLVTDTKSTDKATVQKQFRDLKQIAVNMGAPEVLERIIPQIYKKEMLGWVKEVHPFSDWIFTLYLIGNPDYKDIAKFCAENGIDTVTIHYNRATKANVETLKAKGLKVYVHTINRYLYMKEMLALGADGIYTDRIKPYELHWIGLENSRALSEQTIPVGDQEMTFTTLDIFGTTYAPLRQLSKTGKGFAAAYSAEQKTLNLEIGRIFNGLGNELLMDNSGRLVTKKVDFKLLADGKETGIQCFLVDGEVYAPLADVLALTEKK